MTIQSSAVLSDNAQADGRRWITEAHTDHLGVTHRVGPYLAAQGADVASGLAASATRVAAVLADAEIDANYSEVIGADL